MADWSHLIVVFTASLLQLLAETSTASTAGVITDFTTEGNVLSSEATDSISSTPVFTLSTLATTDITSIQTDENTSSQTNTSILTPTSSSPNDTSASEVSTSREANVSGSSSLSTQETTTATTQNLMTSQGITPDEVTTDDVTGVPTGYFTSPVTMTTTTQAPQTTLRGTQKPSDTAKVIGIAVGVSVGAIILLVLIALIIVLACKKRGGNYNVLHTKQKFDNPLYGSTVTYQNPAMIPDFDAPANHTPDPRV